MFFLFMEFLTFHHPHRNEYKPFNLFVMWNNKLNIYEKEWLAVVFSSRNQSYGAYDLRRYSSVATNKALLTVLCVVALLVVWKVGYDRLPKSTEMRVVEYELPTIEEIVVPDPPAKEEPLPAVEAPIQKIAQDPPAQDLIRYVEPKVTHYSKVTEDVASQDELKTKMSARITLKKKWLAVAMWHRGSLVRRKRWEESQVISMEKRSVEGPVKVQFLLLR